MDIGHDSNNNRKFIDVTQLSQTLGPSVCNALPGIHAFTGCIFTSAFARKCKVRPLEILMQSKIYQHAFQQLGETNVPEYATMPAIESFVCTLYEKKNFKNVNDARLALFRIKYAPTFTNKPLAKLRGADASFLPRTK
jgi:hypothetical protein